MPAARGPMDPLASFAFQVEIQGKVKGFFRECTGLGSESEIVEYKASGPSGAFVVHKVPGRLKWSNIVLKRGITDEMDLWTWRKEVEEGKVNAARRNGSIVMYNDEMTEVARWNFTNGWPSKLTGPVFNAQNNEIGIEELEIVHEGVIRDH